MEELLKRKRNMKTKSIAIFFTEQVRMLHHSKTVLKSIQRWSKTYCEENKSCAVIANGEAFITLQSSGIASLIAYKIQVFNMRRAPIILPKDTVVEQYKSRSEPVIFINIGK